MQRLSSTYKHIVQRVVEVLAGEHNSESVVGTFALLTQLITITRYSCPCVHWCVRMVTRVQRRLTQHAPHVQHCKLRTLAYAVTDEIIAAIQRQPGGYTFWASLPHKGRHNAEAWRKTCTDTLLAALFSRAFLAILLRAALTPEGTPIPGSPLYTWLVEHIYSGKVHKLYRDWLKVQKHA